MLINTLMIKSKNYEDRMYERHQQQIKTLKTNSFQKQTVLKHLFSMHDQYNVMHNTE